MKIHSKLVTSLKHVTEVIFSESTSYAELQISLSDWKESLKSFHGLDMDAPEFNENVYLEEGKAIATRWAALCIDDLVRTKRFVRALKKAVDDVFENRPEGPVTILYVGTGPFATLVVPLTQIFAPTQLQLELIEVNEHSFNLLEKTVDGYGIRAYVRNMHCTDATGFSVEDIDVDILLVECLQQALAREPQVKIVENLIPQLKKDVILIPEDISLKLALVNTTREEEYKLNLDNERVIDFYEIIDTVFSLDKNGILNSDALYEERIIMFSDEELADKNRVSVFTEMKLYRDELLSYNESGLTIPWDVNDFTPEIPVFGVRTRYITGNDPKLDIKLIRTRDASPDS